MPLISHWYWLFRFRHYYFHYAISLRFFIFFIAYRYFHYDIIDIIFRLLLILFSHWCHYAIIAFADSHIEYWL
jgi:hypothetical protein